MNCVKLPTMIMIIGTCVLGTGLIGANDMQQQEINRLKLELETTKQDQQEDKKENGEQEEKKEKETSATTDDKKKKAEVVAKSKYAPTKIEKRRYVYCHNCGRAELYEKFKTVEGNKYCYYCYKYELVRGENNNSNSDYEYIHDTNQPVSQPDPPITDECESEGGEN